MKNTTILGISAFYHDSAACLVVDGEIVAAAQEERFTREKYDARISDARDRLLPRPRRAARRRISTTSRSTTSRWSSSSGCSRPTSRFAPAGFRSFSMAMPVWLKKKLFIRRSDQAGVSRRHQRAAGVPGPSREPRGERVLPQSVRRGGDPDARRRRRMEHGDVRHGRGQQDPPDARAAVPAFARTAVFRVHVLLRLQGQQRRIQADGAGAVRATRLSRPDSAST